VSVFGVPASARGVGANSSRGVRLVNPAALWAHTGAVATLTVGLAQLNDELIMVGLATAALAAVLEWRTNGAAEKGSR
jgi:hypothetical protein